jgi:hypothetical protein
MVDFLMGRVIQAVEQDGLEQPPASLGNVFLGRAMFIVTNNATGVSAQK